MQLLKDRELDAVADNEVEKRAVVIEDVNACTIGRDQPESMVFKCNCYP